MSHITVRIPDTLRRELEKLCRRDNQSMSDVVRQAVRRYIAVRTFEVLRRKTRPAAEAQGLLVDEDIFKIVS